MVARIALPGLAYSVTVAFGLDPRALIFAVTDVLSEAPDGGEVEGVLFGAWEATGAIESLLFGAWDADPDLYEPELETWS